MTSPRKNIRDFFDTDFIKNEEISDFYHNSRTEQLKKSKQKIEKKKKINQVDNQDEAFIVNKDEPIDKNFNEFNKIMEKNINIYDDDLVILGGEKNTKIDNLPRVIENYNDFLKNNDDKLKNHNGGGGLFSGLVVDQRRPTSDIGAARAYSQPGNERGAACGSITDTGSALRSGKEGPVANQEPRNEIAAFVKREQDGE